MATVLVVDDEPHLVDLVRGYVEAEGFAVLAAGDGPSALDLVRTAGPDVVVLDVMLPGMDGVEVCRRLRAFSDAYVLMLTARVEEVARVKAMLRRPRRGASAAGPDAPPVHRVGDLVVDEARHEATRRGALLPLTAREFALLAALAAQPGRVFTRTQLLDRVWGDACYDDHVVDVHVGNLRRKLEDNPAAPRYLETVRGVGYRLKGGRA